MAEIMHYIEEDNSGIRTGRQLIAMRDAILPPAADQAHWQNDPTFDLAQELLISPPFKQIVMQALRSGAQIVNTPDNVWRG
jgi:hypothetical protein